MYRGSEEEDSGSDVYEQLGVFPHRQSCQATNEVSEHKHSDFINIDNSSMPRPTRVKGHFYACAESSTCIRTSQAVVRGLVVLRILLF